MKDFIEAEEYGESEQDEIESADGSQIKGKEESLGEVIIKYELRIPPGEVSESESETDL